MSCGLDWRRCSRPWHDWRWHRNAVERGRLQGRGAIAAGPDPELHYLDLGLLYGRLDAALRPMLLMGAAFMPAMNDYVEIGKLPDPETIKRHLSPIVSSQRYDQNGYAAESIGPLLFRRLEQC